MLTNEYGAVYRWTTVSGVEPSVHRRVVPIDQQMLEGSAAAIAGEPEGDRPPSCLARTSRATSGSSWAIWSACSPRRSTLTPLGSMPRPVWLRVAGVFDAGFYEYNVARAYVPAASARRIYQVGAANQLELKVTSLGESTPSRTPFAPRWGRTASS